MKICLSKNYQETFNLGKSLAIKCQGGEIFALNGPLGAGKTVFAQGLAQGLGIKDTVNSPTFNIIKIYPVKNNSLVKEFVHIDAYRLKSSLELQALGVDEMFHDPLNIILVEWAEKIKDILPSKYIKIDITIGDQANDRQIIIN